MTAKRVQAGDPPDAPPSSSQLLPPPNFRHPLTRKSTTHFPVLALNSCIVSSSAAEMTNSPLSSNERLVNDRPGSLCFRKTREGLKEACSWS